MVLEFLLAEQEKERLRKLEEVERKLQVGGKPTDAPTDAPAVAPADSGAMATDERAVQDVSDLSSVTEAGAEEGSLTGLLGAAADEDESDLEEDSETRQGVALSLDMIHERTYSDLRQRQVRQQPAYQFPCVPPRSPPTHSHRRTPPLRTSTDALRTDALRTDALASARQRDAEREAAEQEAAEQAAAAKAKAKKLSPVVSEETEREAAAKEAAERKQRQEEAAKAAAERAADFAVEKAADLGREAAHLGHELVHEFSHLAHEAEAAAHRVQCIVRDVLSHYQRKAIEAAVIRLQAIMRGRIARHLLAEKHMQRQDIQAAIKLQACIRGRLTREAVNLAKAQHTSETPLKLRAFERTPKLT